MKNERLIKSIFLTLAVLAVSFVFLGVGYYLGVNKVSVGSSYKVVNKHDGQPEELDFSAFWDLWDEVHNRYVDPSKLDDRELVRGAMKGMVEALDDPYSAFMPSGESDIFEQDLEGSFGGVGIMVELKDGNLTVSSPLEDSPADKAGVRSNDIITQIDGQSVEDMSFEEMISNIRGEIGEQVELTIYRPSTNEELVFEIIREEIVVESVKFEMMEDNLGYLRINQFGNDTVGLMDQAIDFFSNQDVSGLVVDLRNNPGGFFDVAIKVTSKFIDQGVIVYQRDRTGSQDFEAISGADLDQYELVVLINEGSASAAEIMAGALRDQKGAWLVGQTSFGKGSVQDLKKINNWGSLRITSGQWLTPEQELINGTGLEPDVVVEMDQDRIGSDGDKQLERAKKLLTN